VDKVEVLLDVLEANSFPGIRSKMHEREEEILRSATLRKILTVEEIEKVKMTLKEFKVPSPHGWVHALMVHTMRQNITGFSEDAIYDYTGLCNLGYTLREAGLTDSVIWGKINAAIDTMERFSSHA
jgi:hypothetical protein